MTLSQWALSTLGRRPEPDDNPDDSMPPLGVHVCPDCNGHGWELVAPDDTMDCATCRGCGYVMEGDPY